MPVHFDLRIAASGLAVEGRLARVVEWLVDEIDLRSGHVFENIVHSPLHVAHGDTRVHQALRSGVMLAVQLGSRSLDVGCAIVTVPADFAGHRSCRRFFVFLVSFFSVLISSFLFRMSRCLLLVGACRGLC